MRVLITGVSGFIGVRLALLLRDLGHEVTGTYIHEAPSLPGIDIHEADLLDGAALRHAFDHARPEAVVHLAGLSHVGDSWSRPAEYFRVNVLGSESVLDLAAGRRVLVASSAAVYGHVPEEEQPIGEGYALAPESPYAWTKAAMERLALRQGAIAVRTFNVIGPGQLPTFALPAFAAQLAAIRRGEQPPTLRVGNLSARRDFLHVDDAAEAYRVLIEQGAAGEVYNLGSGRPWSLREALNRLIATAGVEAAVEVDPKRFRPVDVPLLQADNARLRALGWSPTRSFDEALADLWRAASVAEVVEERS